VISDMVDIVETADSAETTQATVVSTCTSTTLQPYHQKILLLLDNAASHFDPNEEYTDQDKAGSGSENEDVELSNSIDEEIINATEFQDEANLLENNDLDTLLDGFSREDDYSTALTSAVVDFFNDVDQTIATEEALTDQQIITLVQNEDNIIEDDQEDSDKEPSEISTQEAYNALKTWLSFFEQQESSDFDMKDIKILNKYSKIMSRILSDSKKQSSIIDYFQKI
ncbi:18480_t:CDS:2, partial [Racocetra fulgida]